MTDTEAKGDRSDATISLTNTDTTETTAPDTDADAAETKQDRPSRDQRYRQKLRETEAERDALLQRVETLQRGEVQRMVADKLADPEDFWRETTLADLLDDSGDLAPDKVFERVSGLLEDHPHWGQAVPRPSGALKSGASAPAQPRRDPWTTAFAPGRRD